jgi:multidrug efflux system membrane fusion protein
MKNRKRFLFIIPLLCGLFLFYTMVSNKKGPKRPEISERVRTVSIIHARETTVIPRVTGYGYVEPTETWEAIPEVSGKIVEIHPELEKGTFVAKGDLLLKIDPQSYGLAASRGQATVMSVDAQLVELQQEKTNTERLLDIERQAFKLAKQEFVRNQDLFEKGYISASEMDMEKKSLLAQETSIKSLENNLSLLPSREKVLNAQKDSGVSSLSELQLDIEKTEIRAPFDCRLAEVNVELYQYASAGSTLLKAINISAVEIPVQLAPAEFVNLLSESPADGTILDQKFNMDDIRRAIDISATVRLPLFSKEAIWDAQFMRTGESVDMQTGALTVYVAVQNPFAKIKPSERPPLMPNLYCEVELQGRPRANRYIIPVHAVHNGSIYLVDKEKRLKKQTVEVEMVMKDMAVIRDGLSDGDEVITTDVVPAVEGMLLAPVINQRLMAKIDAFNDNQL